MPTTLLQQAGSRGRHLNHPLPLLCALFLLVLAPMPGHTAIHIAENYRMKELKMPPQITIQPESLIVFSSDDIMLKCEATGNPPPTYRWLKDGVEFDPASISGVITSHDLGSITVKDAPIHQFQGNYTCLVSNELGTAVSNEVHIITEDTPTMQREKKEEKKVEEGSPAILHCNPPQSSATPLIHWMDKRLRHIQQSERVTQGRDGNLYFSHVTLEDNRSDYTCNVQFLGARIIVAKEPITLKVTPSNLLRNRRPQMMRPTGTHSSYLVLKGQTLELECIVQGLPTPSIQWVRKDGALSESRTSRENFDRVLSFTNISERDDGEYQCTANNSQGTVTHTYTVSVEAAPYWIKEPKSELYAPGESVMLDCQADGIPSPQITWSINGTLLSEIPPDSHRTVNGGVLRLQTVKLSDTAVYQCKASNKHGTILLNIHVVIIELPPQILTEDSLLYRVTEGKTARLQCVTFGSPRPKIAWEDETWEPVMSNPRMNQLGNGTLEISNVFHNDTGLYTCSVVGHKLSITAELEVLNRTVIVNPPLNLYVQKGKTATFTCQYEMDSNLGPPQILWRKTKKKLDESSDIDKYIIDETELIINDVQDEDEGVYGCEVISSLDMAEASGSLTVVDRPDPPSMLQIEHKAHSVELSWVPGDNHKSPILEYVVEAEEEYVVEAKEAKEEYVVKAEETDTDDWEEIMRVSGDTRRTTLPLKPYLSYRFRVIAINRIGKSNPSLPSAPHSTPADRPSSNPEEVRSESLDPDTLVITWKEMDRRNFNGPGFTYKVMWRKVVGSGPTWHSDQTTSPPFVVTNVGDFTAFDIKVQAVNELGEGPEPKSTIGYPGEDYPSEAPMNIGLILHNSNTIEVKWGPVNREYVRGHLKGYKIRLAYYGSCSKHHHQKCNSEEGVPLNESVVTTGSDENSKKLEGLQPYSSYSLTVSVFNGKGDGPESEARTFQTSEGVPGPPNSLILSSPSETEITLHWTPPLQENGILIGYLIHYQELHNVESPMQVVKIDDPTVHHLTIKDLDRNSHYRFYLRGRTGTGEGQPIIKVGQTTLDGAPPQNITLSAGETTVNITWVVPKRQRNIGFHILYQRKNDRGGWIQSEKVNTSQSFYTLQGLQPGSYYHLRFVYNNNNFSVTDIETEGTVTDKQSSVVTEGWFIGLISALVLLLLILLILCFIKRGKGGKYSVKDKEEGQVDSESRPMKDETFGEYRSLESDNEEKRTASQPSLCEDSKLCSDDGLDEYGNSHSVHTKVTMDESLASQYSGGRDMSEIERHDSSPLKPAATNHGLPNSAADLD
ncbi:neural cell adhesion molecule L1.2 isoform X2 [Tachysurus fulvidraco]|uniref:neural cell adhesion molecule L1.2 isoform X2 n=1 Tax=Tachysurus fulvidraco TaxID=1234273 RepID=UPI001FEF1103|nr:neural cell adhesion molecule L1.2 isoform X2 [Tachysurus fulvidraco]